MFRTATAAAVIALLCAPAMAQSLTVGQYRGITQYTAINDTSGLCGSIAGLAAGQITKSVATVGGLGATWTDTISNSNPSPAAAFGVTWINCGFSGLPAASAFTATSIGSGTSAETEYVAQPTTPTTTNCYASNGTPYVLSSSNSTLGNGIAQTVTITLLPSNGTGLDSGFRVTTTNSALSVGGNTLCYLSTDAVYSHT